MAKKAGSPGRDPFDDDDGGVRDADAAALERMNQRASGAIDVTSADDIEELPIGGSETGEDDDAETPEERLSRRERRRNRYQQLKEENEEYKTRLGRLEEMAQRYPDPSQIAQQVQQNLQPSRDPIEEELAKVRREQTELAELFHTKRAAGSLTAEQELQFRERANNLEDKRVDLIAERKVRQRSPQAGVSDQQVILATLRAQNADVVNNQRASTYANGVYQQLVAQGWEQSLDTANEAFERAREAFRMPTKNTARARGENAQPAAPRERYAGSPAGGGGAGRAEKATTIKITPEIRIMADSAFSHIKDPRARLQKWVNGPGRRLAQQER